MKFADINGWVEVFKAGKHTDSAGNTREWTEDDLKSIVENYNPAEHEAPVVIGHPADNDPAFGWVEKLKAEGTVLYAKFKDLIPEFVDIVKQGLFKKRSIALYPDLVGLRHIGFLGAVPPAVKGLENIQFQNTPDTIVIEFSETSEWKFESIGRILRALRDWLIEKEGKEKADGVIPDWDIEYIKERPRDIEDDVIAGYNEKNVNKKQEVKMANFKDTLKGLISAMGVDVSKVPDDALPESTEGNTYTEQDILARERAAAEAAAKKAADDERKKVEAEFAEKERERVKSQRGEEINSWVTQGMKEGKILPSWGKMGLKEFMQSLDGDETIEFAEGSAKQSRLTWFKAFMEELPKVVEFKEIAKRGDDTAPGSAAEKIEVLIRDKRSKDKELTYSQAFSDVQIEHPDLVAEYQNDMSNA
jgi:hypothetical protein